MEIIKDKDINGNLSILIKDGGNRFRYTAQSHAHTQEVINTALKQYEDWKRK